MSVSGSNQRYKRGAIFLRSENAGTNQFPAVSVAGMEDSYIRHLEVQTEPLETDCILDYEFSFSASPIVVDGADPGVGENDADFHDSPVFLIGAIGQQVGANLGEALTNTGITASLDYPRGALPWDQGEEWHVHLQPTGTGSQILFITYYYQEA